MDKDLGRDPLGQALAVPVEPASSLAPTGFDPSRVVPVRQTVFGDDGNCLRAALATVTSLPLSDVIDVMDGSEPEHRWFERVQEWGKGKGVEIDYAHPDDAPQGFSIGVGLSKRRPGQTHAVVCINGEPWFDPHPSDALIDEVRGYITLNAIAMEARRAETGTGSAHDSAAIAQPRSLSPKKESDNG